MAGRKKHTAVEQRRKTILKGDGRGRPGSPAIAAWRTEPRQTVVRRLYCLPVSADSCTPPPRSPPRLRGIENLDETLWVEGILQVCGLCQICISIDPFLAPSALFALLSDGGSTELRTRLIPDGCFHTLLVFIPCLLFPRLGMVEAPLSLTEAHL